MRFKKMNVLAKALMVIALAAIIPLTSTARGQGEKRARFFEHFDQDNDGRVSIDVFPEPADHFEDIAP